ncbi:MAG: maltotransferase domain-containing protein, partial [Verrucomicrobiales bacterium]
MAESPTKTALRTFSAASAPGDPDSLDAIKGHAPTVVITRLTPSIDGGRYQLKRLPWEILAVEADIFRDGHDILTARLLSRRKGESSWTETMMVQGDSDRWYASCAFPEHGLYQYTIQAWSELWLSWCHDFGKKHDAGMDDLATEILEGSLLVVAAARRAGEADHRDQAGALLAAGETLRASATPTAAAAAIESEKLHALMEVWSDRSLATTAEAPHEVWVDRERAGFSSWYEFFPRGAEGRGDKHSTLRDCVPRLEAASAMGFDVIYFPPIHPIGITARKGADNALEAGPGDPGSPWAIGGSAGGHRSVEPALGTLEDFVWLLGQARERGLEIALDFAINCSPDHPYVREHPEWFFQRPDGSIKYAENPPKKYQDIYPLDFHCADWRNLWREMLELVLFWVDQGVLIFRVDNPHTKPFAFWEYLIAEVRAVAPDTLFFAEAFTRPKLMQMLGKIGFSMSYTYFTWRHSREDFVEYLTELTNPEMADYFRA